MPPQPNTIMPQHPHLSKQNYPYHSLSPQPNYLCPYFNSTPMYSPSVVRFFPHITSLCYPRRPPSRLTSSMLQNLLPP